MSICKLLVLNDSYKVDMICCFASSHFFWTQDYKP